MTLKMAVSGIIAGTVIFTTAITLAIVAAMDIAYVTLGWLAAIGAGIIIGPVLIIFSSMEIEYKRESS